MAKQGRDGESERIEIHSRPFATYLLLITCPKTINLLPTVFKTTKVHPTSLYAPES